MEWTYEVLRCAQGHFSLEKCEKNNGITRFVSINLHQAVYHDSPISVNLTNIQSAQNKRSLSIFLIKNEKDKDVLWIKARVVGAENRVWIKELV